MARRSKPSDAAQLSEHLKGLIDNFQRYKDSDDLRERVLALVPAFNTLRDIGSSLIPKTDAASARDRILFYFRKYPRSIISHEEIMVVSGISEFGRRIRELRTQQGWSITSGQTAREMAAVGEWLLTEVEAESIGTNDYILLSEEFDQLAAHRWHTANTIRRSSEGAREKILKLFLAYVGQPITNEELRYVTGDSTEWARRVRELRTEFGWAIKTRNSDRVDLPVGTYVLESADQLPVHDRRIPDAIQIEVLERDKFACRKCKWRHEDIKKDDPRYALELHHLHLHSKGGANVAENLVTLCNVHHKEVHNNKMGREEVEKWLPPLD